DDYMMVNYLYQYALPFSLIATKADKLGKSKIKPQAKAVADKLKVGAGNIIPVASLVRKGREEVLDKISAIIENFYALKNETDEE
ncbi:MAG: hypothetical protein J6V68_03515, partial [Clostridia bacterium]|nr:hypothetical protein [Clostridia bacterium]